MTTNHNGDFLTKHPIPWSLARELYDGADFETITAANGTPVVRSVDASGYQSWLEGDIDEFIEFVNAHFKNCTDSSRPRRQGRP